MDDQEIETYLRDWQTTRRPEALGELLKIYRHRAYAVALRMTTFSEDAEDAVQDAFIKLLSRNQGFESAAEFERTTCRAVIQCSVDLLRKRRSRGMHEELFQKQTSGGETMSGRLDFLSSKTSLDEKSLEELHARLQTIVDALPDEERLPLVLHYYQGLSVVDTAKTLELPRSTVRARLQRAIERLQIVFQSEGSPESSKACLLSLLYLNGNIEAPATLTARLDQALPGKPCAQLPTLGSHFGSGPIPVGTAALQFWRNTALWVSGVLVATVIGFGVGVQMKSSRVASETVSEPDVQRKERVPQTNLDATHSGASRTQPGSAEVVVNNKEEEIVKSKLAALALASGLLMGSVSAGEPNAQLADVIVKVASRQVEIDAAAAAVTKKMYSASTGEGQGGREGRSGVGAPHVSSPTNAGASFSK